ncbi:MAG: hypothetical protein K8R88_11425, partial [Armatimonadetes bacterium]|nr:hypothetical protein [Armatimonadota bacterium]
MDKTQAIDPNRTMMAGGDMYKTQAMAAAPGFDPNKTGVMNVTAMPPGVNIKVIPGREATMANGPATESFMV